MAKEKILKAFLIFAGCYFIFDTLLHLSNIKLSSVLNSWPSSAFSYAHLLNYIYASFVLLSACICFVIQKDLKKYKTLIIISGIWAVFHGTVLLYLVGIDNYQEVFKQLPSLLVWLPFYKEYLSFNALLLFLYSAVVYLWRKDE